MGVKLHEQSAKHKTSIIATAVIAFLNGFTFFPYYPCYYITENMNIQYILYKIFNIKRSPRSETLNGL